MRDVFFFKFSLMLHKHDKHVLPQNNTLVPVTGLIGIIWWKLWPGSVVRMPFLSNVTVVDHILSIIKQSLGLMRPSLALESLSCLIIIIVVITECITNLFHWKYLLYINVWGFLDTLAKIKIENTGLKDGGRFVTQPVKLILGRKDDQLDWKWE